MPNSEDLLIQHETSLYREVREFETFIMVRFSSTVSDHGLIKDVHAPVQTKYAIWGKVRQIKTYEQEKIPGVFKEGSLIFEFKMPLGSNVPQLGDHLLYHGVFAREPRTIYLVQFLFEQASITIGKCVITPISKNELVHGSI